MNPYEYLMRAAVEVKRHVKGLGEASKFTGYLRSIETKSRDEIHALQAAEMSVFLKHAVEKVPYYSKYSNQFKLSPETVHDDILEFSILTEEDVKNNFKALHWKKGKGKNFRTGGTVGEPLVITRCKNEQIHSPNEYFNELAGIVPGRSRLLIRRAESIYFADKPHDKSYSGNPITRTYSISPAYMDDEKLKLLYNVYKKVKPKIIHGKAEPIYRFARYILDEGLKTYPVKSVIAGGQTMIPRYRKAIEKAFNIKDVYNRYGATEFDVMAQQCNHFEGLHYIPVVHYTEVLDDEYKTVEPGNIGQLIVTNLQKRTMPLIRYKIGDLAVMSDEKCSCGRGFPIIKSFEGRRIESVVSPKHTYMTPLPFCEIMDEFDNVDEFLVEQTAENTVLVKLLMKSGEFSQIQQLALRKEINRYLDYPMKLEIEYIKEIIPLPNGKVMRVKGLDRTL